MQKNKLLIEIIIGSVLGICIILFLTKEKKNFEDFALGNATSSHFASIGEYPIHINKMKPQKINQLIKGWKQRGSKDVVLILGNSQTHSINQFEEGEKTYNHLLFDEYKENYDIITHSIPNANFQELYLTFEFWLTHLPIKMVIIPAFMDDMREEGIRKPYFSGLKELKFTINNDADISTSINNTINGFSNKTESIELSSDFEALKETVQDKSEKALNDFLNKYFSAWEKRPTLRGEIFIKLYLLRNTVLGISAQTKRRMIPKKYKKNIVALTGLINSSKVHEVKCLIYIPPIRSDVPLPYISKEYNNFKAEVKNLIIGKEDYAYFYNLEKLVPGELWGVKAATNLFGDKELDFMHFKYKGHTLLFEELNTILKQNLK